jgi:hypothetical protein
MTVCRSVDIPIDRTPLDRTIRELRDLYRDGDGLTDALREAARGALRDLDYFPTTSRRGLDMVSDGKLVHVIGAAPAIHRVLHQLRAAGGQPPL